MIPLFCYLCKKVMMQKTVAMLILNNPISRASSTTYAFNTFGVLIILLLVSLSACSVTKKAQSLSEQLESNSFTEDMISVESAKRALEEGNAELLLIGGISPTIVIGQKEFKRRYRVDYYDFGDLPIFSEEEIARWNRVIFEWLNVHYGTKWQKDVRQDVIGYKEWVEQSPASK